MSAKANQEDRIADCGDFPRTILIDTTSFCNLTCSMCGHKTMSRKRGNMDMDLYRKIIDEIAEVDKNIRIWLIFFGDPFVIKKTTLFPMIKYAKEKGLTDVVLNSNGNLMDEEAADKLIDSDLDAIYFGVDAFKKETYEKYRVGGDYDTVIKNIQYLLKQKKEKQIEHPKVFVQFVEMEGNKAEVKDFTEFWKKQGVVVKIRPMVSWAGLVEAPNLKDTNQERHPCHWVMQTMSVSNEGKVVLCAVDVDARFIAGDINKESIKDVWKGKLKEIRNLHLEKKFNLLPHPCKDCLDWQAACAEFVEEK